jgi:hypothetical protein
MKQRVSMTRLIIYPTPNLTLTKTLVSINQTSTLELQMTLHSHTVVRLRSGFPPPGASH